jgi:hypothetical protein
VARNLATIDASQAMIRALVIFGSVPRAIDAGLKPAIRTPARHPQPLIR